MLFSHNFDIGQVLDFFKLCVSICHRCKLLTTGNQYSRHCSREQQTQILASVCVCVCVTGG